MHDAANADAGPSMAGDMMRASTMEEFTPYTTPPAPLEWSQRRTDRPSRAQLPPFDWPRPSSSGPLLAAAAALSAASVAGGSSRSVASGQRKVKRGEHVVRGRIYKRRPSR